MALFFSPFFSRKLTQKLAKMATPLHTFVILANQLAFFVSRRLFHFLTLRYVLRNALKMAQSDPEMVHFG